ncbi:hypothetical protein KOR34_10700 [Posidoniimonas corsicana]|uniref:Peptidase M10 metallopeptidase domain-containing protein n=2 Tax=Posidoniimonas corsicana TaxID=1938618 RepID=A0A5C5VE24_9BACT|nr:hypothetical protein KOR34_10700 [Posidoniimonas corsicana]
MDRMHRPLLAAAALLVLSFPAAADVVVISNRTRETVPVTISPTGGKPYRLQLTSGQVVPLFSDTPLHANFNTQSGVNGFKLDANSAYYFGQTDQGLQLHLIGLGEAGSHARPLPGGGRTTPAGVVDVKICVDEEEPLRREQWIAKLRRRVDMASLIMLSHSGMTFRVVSTGSWNSDNDTNDFTKSLKELEEEVPRIGDTLVIGFTSQYQVVRGRTHLGGTRGPLSSHILLREWSQHVSERERLELLVHELGHYLGASHSPEPDSVMRPVLGDRQSRQTGFGIRFDPVNTLIMSMVGEEVRRRGAKTFPDLSEPTLSRLNQIYTALSKTLPQDSSAARFAARTQTAKGSSTSELAKLVVQSITQSGQANQRLPEAGRLTGDDLTDELVRNAAADTAVLRDRGRKPLLLGLGIALDDTLVLGSLPATGQLVREADPPGALAKRAPTICQATMCGRNDLLKHFFVSAALTAATDANQAHAIGVAKEIFDSNRKSGFSFVDLAADRAGVRFAQAVLSGELSAIDIADDFTCYAFMPAFADLPEGLSAAEFQQQYGSPTDARYLALIREIDERIDQLTGYD